jgi:hypothetical protein
MMRATSEKYTRIDKMGRVSKRLQSGNRTDTRKMPS